MPGSKARSVWCRPARPAWLLAALLVALFGAGLPIASRALAQPARPGAAAAAPVTAGVQDGWVNSCDAGQAPDYHPPNSVPAVDSPYWAALSMNTVRFSPPWDISFYNPASPDGKVLAVEQACFNYWLRALAAKGVAPEIAFKPDYNYQ